MPHRIHNILCTLAAAAAAAAAADDFERNQVAMRASGPDGMAGEAVLASAPDGRGGSALRLSWPATHGTHVDCTYRQPLDLPMLAGGIAGTVTLMVHSAPGSAARQIAVRLGDANGETFQWRAPLPPGAGWRPLAIVLDPAKHAGSWGASDKVDKVIDLPVRLTGYAVVLDPAGGAGEVHIDDVQVQAAAAK